jgi:peptidylprolyl isomerase
MFCLFPRAGVRSPTCMLRAAMTRLLMLLALVATLGLAACGDDDDDAGGGGGETTPPPTAEQQTQTEPTVSEQREALKDTSTKPEIPRPTGSPPRRLQVEDIVRGKGPAAKAGDTITAHYAGVTFSTGEEFDASWNRGEPFTFPLGAGQVIEGWDRGFVGMKQGGRRILTIPPELAYGAQGFPPAIGPNETLVFVVDLLEIR